MCCNFFFFRSGNRNRGFVGVARVQQLLLRPCAQNGVKHQKRHTHTHPPPPPPPRTTTHCCWIPAFSPTPRTLFLKLGWVAYSRRCSSDPSPVPLIVNNSPLCSSRTWRLWWEREKVMRVLASRHIMLSDDSERRENETKKKSGMEPWMWHLGSSPSWWVIDETNLFYSESCESQSTPFRNRSSGSD